MSALKVIPWSDVIEATPGLVKSARKIFTRSQQIETPAAVTEPAENETPPERLARVEASLAEIAAQQGATARLVETLAEQNARIVEAIDILRVRTRLLMGLCGVLALVLAGTLTWALR